MIKQRKYATLGIWKSPRTGEIVKALPTFDTREEAETMAKLSSQFKAISPGMTEENATDGLAKMKENVDTLIVIPNDKIFNISDRKTTFKQAFEMIDKVLYLGIQ